MLARSGFVALTAALMVVVLTVPAFAGPPKATADSGPRGGSVSAGDGDGASGRPGSSGSGDGAVPVANAGSRPSGPVMAGDQTPCLSQVVDDPSQWGGLEPGSGQVVVMLTCAGGREKPYLVVADAPPEGGVPVVDPWVLAQEARERLVLPEPALGFSPEGSQVVQLASWLWVDPAGWRPVSASASAGSVTATVTAVPVATRWDMGNGDVVACDGPGVVYQRRWAERPEMTDCKYTYRHSSAGLPGLAYEVSGSVQWQLSWAASGAPGGGDLGLVVMTTTVPLRVDEIQAVIVDGEEG